MKGNEWLVSYDMLSGTMYSEREYALMPYLAYNLVAFYPLFHVRGGPKVERPKADWEVGPDPLFKYDHLAKLLFIPTMMQNFTRTRANEEIFKSLAHSVRVGNGHNTGHHRDLVSDDILHLEFAPYINRIISPPLRPVRIPLALPVVILVTNSPACYR